MRKIKFDKDEYINMVLEDLNIDDWNIWLKLSFESKVNKEKDFIKNSVWSDDYGDYMYDSRGVDYNDLVREIKRKGEIVISKFN